MQWTCFVKLPQGLISCFVIGLFKEKFLKNVIFTRYIQILQKNDF